MFVFQGLCFSNFLPMTLPLNFAGDSSLVHGTPTAHPHLQFLDCSYKFISICDHLIFVRSAGDGERFFSFTSKYCISYFNMLYAYHFSAMIKLTGCGFVHTAMMSQSSYTLAQSGLINFKEKGSKSAVTHQVPVSDRVIEA